MPNLFCWCHITWRFLSSAKRKMSFNSEDLFGSVLVFGCNKKNHPKFLKKVARLRRVEHQLSKGNFKNYFDCRPSRISETYLLTYLLHGAESFLRS
jgi:hypothetical protein